MCRTIFEVYFRLINMPVDLHNFHQKIPFTLRKLFSCLTCLFLKGLQLTVFLAKAEGYTLNCTFYN